MRNIKTTFTLIAVAALTAVFLCSCNTLGDTFDDDYNDTYDNTTADESIYTDDGANDGFVDDMEYDFYTDTNDGMGNDDIYDMGTTDANGVNTNEGSADGGMRTDADNSLLFDDGADGVVNY